MTAPVPVPDGTTPPAEAVEAVGLAAVVHARSTVVSLVGVSSPGRQCTCGAFFARWSLWAKHREESIAAAVVAALRLPERDRETAAKVSAESPPFVDLPSGVEAARYFWHETDRRNRGCDGIDLWRDGADYCYLWVTAMTDHDMWESYLLDVRTSRDGQETRDFLFLHAGGENRFEVEWHQHPVRFEDDSTDRLNDALLWFVGRDIEALERAR